MPEAQRWDLRRLAASMEVQAQEDEARAKHLLWRAEHLRKRLGRMHDELDSMGVPDPEGWGDKLRKTQEANRE